MGEKSNIFNFFSFRKIASRESPVVERRVEDKFRAEPRAANDIRPNSYRERNERVDRNERNEVIERGPRVDRGRQMSPVQRPDRFERRPEAAEFRRGGREDGNQQEWRGRDRPQGKHPLSHFYSFNWLIFKGEKKQTILLMPKLINFHLFRSGPLPSEQGWKVPW